MDITMNFLKRAWFAVIRKPSRTLIMLIIFFAVANLVLTGIAIQKATEVASDNARQQLGGTLTLSFDLQQALKRAQNTAATDSSTGYRRINFTRDPVTEAMATTIAKQKNILGYNIIVSTVAMAKGFSPVVTSSTSSTTSTSSQAQNKFGNQNQNANQRQNVTPPDVTVIGLSDTKLYDDFNNGTAVLNTDDGSRALTSDDKGKHNILIEKELASQNNLKVGSKITLTAQNSTTEITYTIVGMYTGSTQNQGSQGGGGADQPYTEIFNHIYTDYSSALEIKTNAEAAASSSTAGGGGMFRMPSPGIDSVVYYLDDAKNIDAARADIAKMNIDWTKFIINADDQTYIDMVGEIQKVAQFATLVVYLVAIVGAVILALILLLNIRERMYETGVLLSMGEAKIKVLLQYVVEMIVIAAVAFSVSVVSGGYIAQEVGSYLVTNQITTDNNTTQTQQQNGRFGGGGARSFALKQLRAAGGINKSVTPISDLKISIDIYEIGELCLAGLIIILIATIIPAISIMRFNPKSILTRAG
jgi:putative ABC transport system permease protein